MLHELILKTPDKELKTNIGLPISTHICYPNLMPKLYRAYANFLDGIHLKKPSELINLMSELDERKVKYFLKYVCIPDVMDSSYKVFDSAESVDNERIKLLQFLIELDPDKNEYIEEISLITQKYRVNKTIQILDESRIDFDLRKIRNSKKEIFTQNFKRYIDIGNFDSSYNVFDINDSTVVVLDYYNETDHSAVTEKKNQKFILFKEMFLDYRDEFVLEQYGLDASLSARIRHGRLENQLRSVFEQYGLVYSKASINADNYIPSDDLEAELLAYGIDRRCIDSVHITISSFSQRIDNMILEINSNWIRVRTETLNPTGMFDFSFSESELLIIFSVSTRLKNEEILIDYFEKVFIKRTEEALHALQNRLKDELKYNIIQFMNQLEQNLTIDFKGHEDTLIYQNIRQKVINCRTSIQREVNKIATWFKLPKEQEYIDFSFNQLLETCEAINKKLYTTFEDIALNINISCSILLKGITFSYFTDIFVILFSNAVKHSGFFNDLHNLKIELTIEEIDNIIHIKMINNLSTEIDKKQLAERSNEVRKTIEDNLSSKKYYSFEGGSGYVKIVRMMRYNIGVEHIVLFGPDPDDQYSVEIYILDRQSIVSKGEVCENTAD